LILAFTAIVFCVFIPTGSLGGQAGVLSVVQRAEFKQTHNAIVPRGACTSQDRRHVYVSVVELAGEGEGVRLRLWLWELSPGGERLREILLLEEATNLRAIPPVDHPVCALPTGEVIVVAGLGAKTPTLIKVDVAGQVQFRKPLPDSTEWNSDILSMFLVPTGDVILVGRSRQQASAWAVNGQGDILWRKRYQLGDVACGTDGVSVSDGEYVLCGGCMRSERSASWLLRIDSKGNER